ncbi:maleylpyruvate isomerase N-terminal domain-containing protein [Kitasatospora sp. NPDC101157]|uniref:maleylpyruvate isomerase N-terminal domain-containing protein n=1 Tax=Kitasatospora sp. NPDC101157 TaxID=3364098 RepID=UPI00381E90D0
MRAATDRLLRTTARLSDADVRTPSPLPGRSRGHVPRHPARSAGGGRRGGPGRARVCRPRRTRARRSGRRRPRRRPRRRSRRGPGELPAGVRASAAASGAEYRWVPAGGGQRPVRWTRGQERPAVRAAHARRCEVLVPRGDLDAGFTPARWPPVFTRAVLARVAAALAARAQTRPCGCGSPAAAAHTRGAAYEPGAVRAPGSPARAPQCAARPG